MAHMSKGVDLSLVSVLVASWVECYECMFIVAARNILHGSYTLYLLFDHVRLRPPGAYAWLLWEIKPHGL